MSKTHFKKLRNPNYLGSWDLMDDNGKITNRVLVVSDVKKDNVFDGTGKQEECVVVYFNGVKPMIMNATNLKTISKILESPFIEDWVDQPLEITVKKIKAFGEFHDALRVSPKKISITAPVIDVDKCIKILELSTNISQLQSNWSKLSSTEQKNGLVLAKKDELKAVLK